MLSFLLSHDLDGVNLDWEDQYGNDMDCFHELWMHVSAVIGTHGKTLDPWVRQHRHHSHSAYGAPTPSRQSGMERGGGGGGGEIGQREEEGDEI